MQGVLPIIKRNPWIYVLILWVLFCTWSACNLANTTKNDDTVTKYVLPAYKKAIDLKLKNPDSTLLLCDYMLRLTNNNQDADSLRFEIELLKAQIIINKGFDDKAMDMYKQMLEVQTKMNKPFEIALINHNMADLLANSGRSIEAESFVNDALKGFDLKKDKKNRGRALNLKGLISMNLGRFKEAQISLNEALNIFDNEQSSIDYAHVLQNIGNVYFDLKDSILAREYYIRCAAIHEKANNINNLGSIYNNIGILYRYSNPDSALYYYNKVPATDGENENNRHYVIALFNKANIYKDRREFEKALEVFDEVYRICETYNILQGFPRVLYSYGDIEYEMGHYSKAMDYIDQAIYWCDSLGAIPLKQDILVGKIYMYSDRGMYKEAFQLQQQFDRTEDSIKGSEIKESVTKIENMNRDRLMLMDKLEKERQLKSKATADNKRLLILLPAMMAIIIGGGLYYRYRKRKQSITG